MLMDLEDMSKDQLIERIYELQTKLDAVSGDDRLERESNLAKTFRLSRVEADLLLLMSDGRLRSKEQIYNYLYSDRMLDAPSMKIIDVRMCRLRAAVTHYGVVIDTHHSLGYQLVKGADVIRRVAGGEVVVPIYERYSSPTIRRLMDLRSADLQRAYRVLFSMAGGPNQVNVVGRDLVVKARSGKRPNHLIRSLERHGLITVIRGAPSGGRHGVWTVRVNDSPIIQSMNE